MNYHTNATFDKVAFARNDDNACHTERVKRAKYLKIRNNKEIFRFWRNLNVKYDKFLQFLTL